MAGGSSVTHVIDDEICGRDVHRRRGEPEDSAVEKQFREQSVLNVLRLSEPMLFTLVHPQRTWESLLFQCRVYHFRLVRRHNFVLVALKQEDRAGEQLRMK